LRQATSRTVASPSNCQATAHCSLLTTAQGRVIGRSWGQPSAGISRRIRRSALRLTSSQTEATSSRSSDPTQGDRRGQNRTPASGPARTGRVRATSVSSATDQSSFRSSTRLTTSSLTSSAPTPPRSPSLAIISFHASADIRCERISRVRRSGIAGDSA
jgi:hypothetical protein